MNVSIEERRRIPRPQDLVGSLIQKNQKTDKNEKITRKGTNKIALFVFSQTRAADFNHRSQKLDQEVVGRHPKVANLCDTRALDFFKMDRSLERNAIA